ncbi:MAG TPA: fatty acid desaturase, partial [Aliiroseovarius sp.]|nr:fatty acid desaturase [Aliiroseovarius sp.]
MSDAVIDAPSLRESARTYNRKSNALAALSYFANFAVYFLTLYLAIRFWDNWLVVVPTLILMAFAGVRLYVLQHDCGHLSLFATRKQNEWAGLVLSTFTFTPFKVMQYNHNMHHTYVGNLDARDTTEIFTMTLKEWKEASPWRRLYYRLYRNPFILIPVGAFWTYFFVYRWPKNTRKVGVAGVLVHDALLLGYMAVLFWLFGWTGVGVLLLSTFIGGMLGVFLVYLQHNFEHTYWDRKPDLDFVRATIQGSSCLEFGWVFDEAVANITKHDIHHFNASIPSYRLRQAHRELEGQFG